MTVAGRFFSLFYRSRAAPWTCRACSPVQLWSSAKIHPGPGRAHYQTRWSSTKPGRAQKRPRRVVLLASTAAAGAGLVAISDDVKHSVTAAERSGRVLSTLAACIYDYNVTLKKHEDKDYDVLLKACHKRCALRTLRTLEKNGSIFIKLGQHLSSLNYLLPSEWCDTFIPLQDKCPVSSFESIRSMVLEDSGHELSDYFESFDETPIGAASLAQVHLATMKGTGERVAVKVQHPSLDEWAPLDLKLTHFTFESVKYWFPDYDLTWLSDEMMVSLPQELNFVGEGDNAEVARKHFSDPQRFREIGANVVIPRVLVKHRRMLVMEYEPGKRLDDLEYLDKNDIDRDEVSAALARIFNEMIFGRNAPLHCDPHGGNIAIRVKDNRGWRGRGKGNFDIIIYDHGLYRRIPLDMQRSYAKLWLAVLNADLDGMKQFSREVAGIDDQHFTLFASAITGRDFEVISTGKIRNESRNEAEKDRIGGALVGSDGDGGAEGLLKELVGLLGNIPRVLLLVLKTNDLTRSLDENLHTTQGPFRTFLILARYASRTVYDEQLEDLQARGSILWPSNLGRFVIAWWDFSRTELKLNIFEGWLWWRKVLGLGALSP